MRVSATRSVDSLISKSAVSLINSAAVAQAGCAPSNTDNTTDRAVIRAGPAPAVIASDPGGATAGVAERPVAV